MNMKLHRQLLTAVLLIGWSSWSVYEGPRQEKSLLPPALNQASSLTEILSWLDANAFPNARVGVKITGTSGASKSFGLQRKPVPGGERIFSEGFHLKSVDGCQVTLSNDKVNIIDSANPSRGAFHRFISQENGMRELAPQLALVFLPLSKMSDKRGKGPYLQTDDQAKAKLLGSWRTSFEKGGFFTQPIFDVELTAAEEPHAKEVGSFDYVTFAFDNKQLAEQFNAALRRAITMCSGK